MPEGKLKKNRIKQHILTSNHTVWRSNLKNLFSSEIIMEEHHPGEDRIVE
jgi:hypothetical protein